MGWFDGGSTLGDWAPGASSSKHHRSHSRDKHHRSSSRHRSSGSIFGSGDHHKHNSSRTSIFGGGDHHKHNSSRSSLFGGNYDKHNSSRSSFFGGFGGASRSSSHYKRSPRGGFMKRAYSKLRRLLRDLIYYMKRNPMKVFMLVIMPLITGGALTGLLHKFGIRMPHSIEKMMGGPPKGVGRDPRGNMQYERTSVHGQGPLGAMGGMGGAMNSMGGVSNVVGAMGGIGSAMKMAKMFM